MASKVIYQIKTSLSTTQGLTGSGEEWILDAVSGEMIARFWNGNLMASSSHNTHSQAAPAGLMEETTLLLKEAA